MSGWIWPSSPSTGSWTVSTVVHAYAGDDADVNTNAPTTTRTATTATAMIGVRKRSKVDGSS